MTPESPSFTLGSEWNDAGSTLRVSGESASFAGERQVYLSLNDGTADNAVRVYRDTDRTLYVEVTKAGVQQCLLDMGALADDTAFSLAARIAPDDMAASLNGGAEVTGTGEVPTVTTGNIGHELGGDQCNSILSEITVYPHTAFTDSELIQISGGETVEIPEETIFTVHCAPPKRYRREQIDGQVIREDDFYITLPAEGLAIVPNRDTDTLTFDGVTYTILRADPHYSGEQVAYYTLHCRV